MNVIQHRVESGHNYARITCPFSRRMASEKELKFHVGLSSCEVPSRPSSPRSHEFPFGRVEVPDG